VVQLGVFSNPLNAQELVERLKKLGIRAYTETRVQVGPFQNKAEADKAQAELKRLGISGLVGTTK
jgi:DedD protein